MFRRVISAVVALLAAASLALVAIPASAANANTNAPGYWQTPGTSEVCDSIEPGGTSYTLPAPPAGSVWTKVVVKAGSAPQSVDFENNAYYSDPTYYYNSATPYTQWNQVGNLQATTFAPASNKEISHVIRCWAPVPATPVAGGAATTNESCVRDALVGGVITVDIKSGVTYTITGPSGAVLFDGTTGMTAPLPTGLYTVGVTATAGYTLSGPASIPLTVLPYGDDCGDDDPTPVTPSATVVDQSCLAGVLLLGGSITVGPDAGVTYTITGPSGAVAFNPGTRKTGELPPGIYTVHPVAKPGFALTSAADLIRQVFAYDDDCGLDTKPGVAPAAVQTQMTCFGDATFTLSDDQPGLSATIWTIDNGLPLANGVHTVSTEGSFIVHAAPAPGFTFTGNQQTDWPFTFVRPLNCELTTLALTGDDTAGESAWYAVMAAGLGLLGAMLIRRAGRPGRRVA